MPIVEHSAVTSTSCTEAFDLSMSVAQRFAWDPFIKGRRLLDGATCPGVGRVDALMAALESGLRALPDEVVGLEASAAAAAAAARSRRAPRGDQADDS